MIVVDASVAFKRYVPEEDADLARDLVSSGRRLVAPELVLAEVANACWKLLRRGALSPAQHARIASALPRPFEELVRLAVLLPRAGAISVSLDHPIYDCFYIALSEAQSAPLVTVDSRLLAKARGTPFQVVSLRSLNSD